MKAWKVTAGVVILVICGLLMGRRWLGGPPSSDGDGDGLGMTAPAGEKEAAGAAAAGASAPVPAWFAPEETRRRRIAGTGAHDPMDHDGM